MTTDSQLERFREALPDYNDPIKMPTFLMWKLNRAVLRMLSRRSTFTLRWGLLPVVVFLPVHFLADALWTGDEALQSTKLVTAVFPLIFAFSVMVGGMHVWTARNQAKPQEKARNEELYASIFAHVKSNIIAEELFLATARHAEPDIYSLDVNESINAMLLDLRENTDFAQRNCAEGHGYLCAHKIPPHITKWVAASA